MDYGLKSVLIKATEYWTSVPYQLLASTPVKMLTTNAISRLLRITECSAGEGIRGEKLVRRASSGPRKVFNDWNACECYGPHH